MIRTSAAVASLCFIAAGCMSPRDRDYVYSYDTSPAVGSGSNFDESVTQSSRFAQQRTATTQQQATGTAASETTLGQSQRIVIPLFQEQVQVGTRQVDAGTVRLRKVIESETVNQPVTLREEKLVLERLPAGEAQAGTPGSNQFAQEGAQPFQEQTMTIRLTREEPVLETRVVQTGQIVAETQLATQQTNIQRQVRNEDIQIESTAQAQNITVPQSLRANVVNSTQASGAAAQPQRQTTQPPSAIGGGTSPGTEGSASGIGAGGPITSLQTFADTEDLNSLTRRTVMLTNVRAGTLHGDRLITIQSPGGQELLVRSETPITGISEGDPINVRGTVVAVPDSPADLKLPEDQTELLRDKDVYIQAVQLSKANQ